MSGFHMRNMYPAYTNHHKKPVSSTIRINHETCKHVSTMMTNYEFNPMHLELESWSLAIPWVDHSQSASWTGWPLCRAPVLGVNSRQDRVRIAVGVAWSTKATTCPNWLKTDIPMRRDPVVRKQPVRSRTSPPGGPEWSTWLVWLVWFVMNWWYQVLG